MFHVQLGAWDMGLLSNQLCDELEWNIILNLFLSTCLLRHHPHDPRSWWGRVGQECRGSLSLTKGKVSECCEQDHVKASSRWHLCSCARLLPAPLSGIPLDSVAPWSSAAWKVSLSSWTQNIVGIKSAHNQASYVIGKSTEWIGQCSATEMPGPKGKSSHHSEANSWTSAFAHSRCMLAWQMKKETVRMAWAHLFGSSAYFQVTIVSSRWGKFKQKVEKKTDKRWELWFLAINPERSWRVERSREMM